MSKPLRAQAKRNKPRQVSRLSRGRYIYRRLAKAERRGWARVWLPAA